MTERQQPTSEPDASILELGVLSQKLQGSSAKRQQPTSELDRSSKKLHHSTSELETWSKKVNGSASEGKG